MSFVLSLCFMGLTMSGVGMERFFPTTGVSYAIGQGQGEVVHKENATMELLRETNVERSRYGLPLLKMSPSLNEAASVRAKEIVQKFSHTRPDGSAWKTVSAQARGENIARGHNSVQRVMAAWMSSPGHRKNILRQSFGSIGVSAVNVGGVIHWVQLFGK
jgi:uncharacterized protein YkwD